MARPFTHPVRVEDSDDQQIVVNRADSGDARVVISWTDELGQRQAAGLRTAQARKMANALIVAAAIVEGALD